MLYWSNRMNQNMCMMCAVESRMPVVLVTCNSLLVQVWLQWSVCAPMKTQLILCICLIILSNLSCIQN